jgi:hypothetical protein
MNKELENLFALSRLFLSDIILSINSVKRLITGKISDL